MSGFENSVIGMNPGETKTAVVAAADAYGPHDEKLVKVINRSEFPGEMHPEVGLQLQIERQDGEKSFVTVTDVTETSITLDANHPLAGKNLVFEIELQEIVKPGPDASQLYALGIALQDHNHHDEAASHYLKAIRIKPDFIEAYYNLGVAFQHLGQVEKAIASYKEAIALDPAYASAHLNLGIAFEETMRYEEALKSFEKALETKPDYAMAHYHIGNVLFLKGQFEEAKKSYEKAVSLNHEYAAAHLNIAAINLLLGNFREGWKGYEWRWKLEGVSEKRNISQPLWNGSDIAGKTILIYAEQEFGDTIQFIRYIPLCARRGAKVIVECPKGMKSLLQNVEGAAKVITHGEQVPDFELYCPLLSLPSIFDTTIANIPADIPYLSADKMKAEKWKECLGSDGPQLKVGLAWSGDNALLKLRNDQPCSLEMFSPLGRFTDVTFYSLRKKVGSSVPEYPPAGMNLVDYAGNVDDFSDTAALIENLDLVISVDSSVAHLAGALGKPVWTLLPFVPAWQWMLGREDSPWYPTMRLFRQSSPGDWKSVLERVGNELKKFIDDSKNSL
jgi:FKBP-type peptidyl-prolyl cis-trans isomerase 2